ncbi:DUF1993 family protein [Microbulbifer litoralis]|uniref:DUF1993 family protein n=1 Tax=Microbulbifer litoralis TaxID=2933965 RepID=UPI00202878CE|nr:DUF1993 domain-containing protein [Microbulbifer sp. GX H0434]
MSQKPVAVFLYYLHKLSALSERARDMDDGELLQARLAPEMFPLGQQITTAVSFAPRTLCPLAKLEVPDLGCAGTFAEIRALIQRTEDFIRQIPESAFADFEAREVTVTAGFAERVFTGDDFLDLYGVPNFLFHYAMAYAILRAAGIPVGKGDFDGFHEYPVGFSFPA